ncbi:MAG: Kelch repeat-containing protein [Thermoplasmata archaeon]
MVRGFVLGALLLLLLASMIPLPRASGTRTASADPTGGPLLRAMASLARTSPAGPGHFACHYSAPGAASCPAVATGRASTLSGPAWVVVNTSRAPSPRADAQMVYDAATGVVLLFGGSNATLTPPICQTGCAGAYSDTWTYSDGTWTKLASAGPSPRIGESLVYDAADGEVLLFGGELACGAVVCPISGSTWAFHDGRWTPLLIAGPSARLDAPITYDARDGYVLLFGGILASGTVANDTWAFRGGGWSQQLTAGPPPDAYQESMTYDAADRYVLLVGTGSPGLSGLLPNVTWTYSGGRWTEEFPSTSPPFLWGAWVAYDPAVAYVVLVGEQVYTQYGAATNVTWGFLDGTWFPVSTENPSLRLGLSPLVYDATDGYLVAFGGDQWPNGTLPGGLLNDTWTFVAPPLGFDLSVSTNPPGICAGNADSCPAGTNATRITLSLEAVYESGPPVPGTSFALAAQPSFTFVPFGKLAFSTNLSLLDAVSSCFDPFGFTVDCNTNVTIVAVAPGVVGLHWGWSLAAGRDQFVDRARWSASFNAFAAAPPFGTFPVDSCTTPSCFSYGSGAVNGSFTSVTVHPFENNSVESVSFPPGLLTVEPPSGPPPTPIRSILPPPAPTAISGPPISPSVVPPGAPGSTPVPPGAGPGIIAPAPIVSGAIAAGFTRLRVKRKVTMAVAAPAGAPPSGTRLRRKGGGAGAPPPSRRSKFGD